MATLAELMAEYIPGVVEGQTKSASVKSASTSEIDQVLEGLGLGNAENVKTASENVEQNETSNGGAMKVSLSDIYNQVMSQEAAPAAEAPAAPAAEIEKVAASTEEHPFTNFGELVGDYYNVMFESMVKESADLEDEAGKGESPVAHQGSNGSMSAVIGKPADAHLPVNHSASSGAPLKVTTQGHSPYSLAVKQKILKRMSGEGIVGEQK